MRSLYICGRDAVNIQAFYAKVCRKIRKAAISEYVEKHKIISKSRYVTYHIGNGGRRDMSRIRLSELEKKEVINCCDCKKLGYINDLIIDDCKGCIEALVVPEGGKWCSFFGDGKEYIIPFSCIKRIGPDLVLVEIHEEK